MTLDKTTELNYNISNNPKHDVVNDVPIAHIRKIVAIVVHVRRM